MEALAFNDDGSEFICAHADGSYVVWTTTNSLRPKENPYTPYGELKMCCVLLLIVEYKEGHPFWENLTAAVTSGFHFGDIMGDHPGFTRSNTRTISWYCHPLLHLAMSEM